MNLKGRIESLHAGGGWRWHEARKGQKISRSWGDTEEAREPRVRTPGSSPAVPVAEGPGLSLHLH